MPNPSTVTPFFGRVTLCFTKNGAYPPFLVKSYDRCNNTQELNLCLPFLTNYFFFQCKRGGKVVFQDIAKPSTMEWGTPLQAAEAALELEKTVSFIYIWLG